MATRCFSPPDSVAGYLRARSRSPSWSISMLARSRASAWRPRISRAGNRIFSSTVNASRRLKDWNMKPTLAARIAGSSDSFNAVTSVPAIEIVPEVGRISAPSIDRSVVLPEPEGPMIRTSSPRAIDSETSSTARTAVCPDPNTLTRCSALRTFSVIAPPPLSGLKCRHRIEPSNAPCRYQ